MSPDAFRKYTKLEFFFVLLLFFFLFKAMTLHLNARLLTCELIMPTFQAKREPITFLPTFGILNSAVFCPLKAFYLIKACMHGWGRQGERKASLNPYFAGGGGEGGHSQV